MELTYTLQKTIRFLSTIINPDCVMLFGSINKGYFNVNSDIDLVVITSQVMNSKTIESQIQFYLREHSLKSDVFLFTPEEIKEKMRIKDAFICSILKEAKILYKKEKNIALLEEKM